MTDLDAIENLQKLLGVGQIYGPIKKKEKHHKESYLWQVSRNEVVEEICKLIYPYMSPRRQSQIERHHFKNKLVKSTTWFTSEEVKWAWFAAEFEGEGSFLLVDKKYFRLYIPSQDKWVIDKCKEIAGTGSISKIDPSKDHPYWAVMYSLSISSRKYVHAILPKIIPYLHSRRSASIKTNLLQIFTSHLANLKEYKLIAGPESAISLTGLHSLFATNSSLVSRKRNNNLSIVPRFRTLFTSTVNQATGASRSSKDHDYQVFKATLTDLQMTQLDQHLANCQEVYNWALQLKYNLYISNGDKVSYNFLSKELTLRKSRVEHSYLLKTPANVLQLVLGDVDKFLGRAWYQKNPLPILKFYDQTDPLTKAHWNQSIFSFETKANGLILAGISGVIKLINFNTSLLKGKPLHITLTKSATGCTASIKVDKSLVINI